MSPLINSLFTATKVIQKKLNSNSIVIKASCIFAPSKNKLLIVMIGKLKLTNSLTRKKELFEPINSPKVGMYVCGPTVYSNVHLGNLRTFISFDIINRYLKFLGYKVRYVRNITDIDDKIIESSKEQNISIKDLNKKIQDFYE